MKLLAPLVRLPRAAKLLLLRHKLQVKPLLGAVKPLPRAAKPLLGAAKLLLLRHKLQVRQPPRAVKPLLRAAETRFETRCSPVAV